jgi:hypothetical protein
MFEDVNRAGIRSGYRIVSARRSDGYDPFT